MSAILNGSSEKVVNLPRRCAINKLGRINEIVDELNKLKLGGMAASPDTLYYSGSFDELDAVSLLEQVIGPEYQSKTSQRFQNRLKRAHFSGSSVAGTMQRFCGEGLSTLRYQGYVIVTGFLYGRD